MAIGTADEFFAVVERSNLLSREQLARARRLSLEIEDPQGIARQLIEEGALTRWQANQLLAGRGTLFIGKYKLLEPLGRGGMGRVFLAEHVTMNRRVALKILSRQIGKDPAALERFFAEARAIATLDDPHIVQAYSVDNDADLYYIVMEYVDGQDLQRMVEAEGLPDFESVADCIRQAAEGLAHAHQRKMIHCDIKPANLLVNSQGVVKILDMGLARLNGPEQDDSSSQDDRILGSVDYLAPEQALRSDQFDHRADIYALGCTLYFLLVGHPPFPEGTLHQRILKHQTAEPQPILQQRPDAPPDLVDLCQRMMAKNPDDRPQSAEEISQALSDWQPPEKAPARPAVLKVAEPLDDLDLAKVSPFDLGPVTAPALAPVKRKSGGWPGTPIQRITVGVVVAGMIGVMLVGVVAVLLNSDKRTGDARRPSSNDPVSDSPIGPSPELPTPPLEAAHDQHSETPAKTLPQPPAPPPPSNTTEPPAIDSQAPKPPEVKPTPEEPVAKPEPPKKEPPPPPKPATAEKPALQDLKAGVDLPLLAGTVATSEEAAESISFGELHLKPGAKWEIELISDTEANKSQQPLLLQREPSGTSWTVQLDSSERAGSAPESPAALARIWLDNETLRFCWLAGAPRSQANQLRLSALAVRSRGESHWIALTLPQQVDPLVVNLDSGVARSPLPIADWMTKGAALRLQVVELEGPFPTSEFKPADRTSDKGKVEILFSGTDVPEISFEINLATKRRPTGVELSARYQLGKPPQWHPLKPAEAGRQLVSLTSERDRLQQITDKMQPTDPKRAPIRERREVLKASVLQLENVAKFYQGLYNTGKIHFRVFHSLEGRDFDLFFTKPPTPEKSSG